VNGTNHETDTTITVAGGRDYCVWVDVFNEEYWVTDCPEGWEVQYNYEYYAEEACGPLVADSLVSVSFEQVS
jgi:trans-2-enoyl-CoA reductase